MSKYVISELFEIEELARADMLDFLPASAYYIGTSKCIIKSFWSFLFPIQPRVIGEWRFYATADGSCYELQRPHAHMVNTSVALRQLLSTILDRKLEERYVALIEQSTRVI